MPNYIKNRIELIGSPEAVRLLVESHSTFFPSVQHTSYDGKLTFKNGSAIGWLNEKTNEFERRETETVIGVPDGYTPYMEAEWTRFPDFSKIIPIPEDLNIASSSLGEAGMSHLYGISTFMGKFEDAKRFAMMSEENKAEAIELGKKYKSNLDKYGFTTWYEWSIDKWGTKWNASSCEKISDNLFDFETAWSGVPELIRIMSSKFNGKILYKYSDEDTGCNVGVFEFDKGNILSKNIPVNQSVEAYNLAFELRPDYKENYKLVGDTYEYIDEE